MGAGSTQGSLVDRALRRVSNSRHGCQLHPMNFGDRAGRYPTASVANWLPIPISRRRDRPKTHARSLSRRRHDNLQSRLCAPEDKVEVGDLGFSRQSDDRVFRRLSRWGS